MNIGVIEMDGEPALSVTIPLAERKQQLHLLLSSSEARYYLMMDKEAIAIDRFESQVDRAVYLVLADLAKEQTNSRLDSPSLIDS